MRVVVILLSVSAAWGGEFVVFPSGARMRIDRHETIDGGKFRLYQGSGSTELSASDIVRFEPDERQAAPPAQPPLQQSLTAPAAPAEAKLTPQQLADRAADKYGVPRWLVRSVMAAESGGAQRAVSPKGAIGLMQLMPSTAADLGIDPNDPAQNVDAGVRYLRDLLVKYNGHLWHALAAYNAGPAAVDKYDGKIPPYRETIQYIDRIDRDWLKNGSN